RGPDRAQDLLPVLGAVRIDRELAHALALRARAGDQVDGLKGAAGLRDLSGELAERLLARIELDADRDAVLGGGGHSAPIIGRGARPASLPRPATLAAAAQAGSPKSGCCKARRKGVRPMIRPPFARAGMAAAALSALLCLAAPGGALAKKQGNL